MKLVFGKGNAKLGKNIFTFSLPAGYSCPFAKDCLSKANRETGKIKDGKETEFRCFSASAEALFPNVRKSRWDNFELLKKPLYIGKKKVLPFLSMIKLIENSLPKKAKTIRVHVSGDFFNYDYFLSWIHVARNNPHITFYAYTKCISYWVSYEPECIPSNFILTASYGGKDDHLIDEYNLKSAIVVYSEKEAEDLGLQIDHDDSLALNPDVKKFALLIHGIQPKGKFQPNKIYGYGEKVSRKPLPVI